MKIKGAVLIIGSLLWDPDQGKHIGLRKKWRRDKLIMREKIHVKAPIRYGRCSGGNHEKHYTMIFSKSCDKNNCFGTAYVIPLRRKEICSLKGIENQARFLSVAEGANDRKLCKGDKIWCTVGILFNPNLNSERKQIILCKWKNLIEKDGGLTDFQEYRIGKEKSVLSDHGEVLINWPKAIDKTDQSKVDDFDIIIATCTKPNLDSYPSIEKFQKIAQDDKRKYFYQNIKNGITTFKDRLILK